MEIKDHIHFMAETEQYAFFKLLREVRLEWND